MPQKRLTLNGTLQDVPAGLHSSCTRTKRDASTGHPVRLVVLGISLCGAQYHIRDAAVVFASGVCSAAAYVMSKLVTSSAGLVFGEGGSR
jgi:hypothetical protein